MADFNQQGYISSTFMAAVVEVFLNGIYTAVILTTLSTVVSRHGFRHLLRSLIPVISLMYIVAAISAWAQISMVANTFLKPRHSKEEVTLALVPQKWQNVFIALAYPVNGVVADCIMIWRCYMIWGRNKWIILIASVLTFAQIPFAILTILYDLEAFTGYMRTIQFFKILAISSTALSLASTVMTTALIIYRILTVGGRRFIPVIEIIVESALLYSITLIVVLPFGVSQTNFGFVPAAVNRQITGIAPTLIVARLLLGVKTLEKRFPATVTSRAGRVVTSNDHRMSAVRFHPSFTDPTKTDDGILSASTQDCYDCEHSRTGAGGSSHAFPGSRGCYHKRRDDVDDDDEDDRTSTVSSCRFESPPPPPVNSRASREPV